MKRKFTMLAAALAALILSVAPAVATAQTASGSAQSSDAASANSLRISPVRSEIALDPGASKQVQVFVQNLTPKSVQVRAVVNDFEPSTDESGDPLLLLDDSYAKTHSLRRLAIVSPEILSLQPNERAATTLTVTTPKTALPGGYYGAVRFLPASQESLDGNGVSIATNLASLVLLRINGPTKEKVTLSSMDVRQKNKPGNFFRTPKNLTVVARFRNQGNIQEQPFGEVRILSRGDKVVEEHNINDGDTRGNVLPDSTRRFEVSLKKISKFGKYTVEGNFSYKNGGEAITAKTTFWVVPVSYMIAAGVTLVIVILLIIFIPKMIRAYNRKIVSRAGRRY